LVAERAVTATRDANRGTSSSFRLGQISLLASNFLPKALGTFRRAYPKVDIELHEMRSEEQIAALNSGAIELGFTAAPETGIPPRMGRNLGLKPMMAFSDHQNVQTQKFYLDEEDGLQRQVAQMVAAQISRNQKNQAARY